MRLAAVFLTIVIAACGVTASVRPTATIQPTPTASATDTFVTPTPTAVDTPTASVSPSGSPSPSPTPTRSPRLPDPVLEAQARATVDAIALPKVFQYRIQLYEPLGPFHAGFGGFSGGVAILLIGRDDVRSNIVTHEYGHAWHEYFMRYDTKIWAEYGVIRGYTDPIQLIQGANYFDDWRERFANDFQWAFNPDYGGQYVPGPGYWDPLTFQRFRDFVKGLPARS